jgi:NAD(P)H-nitrite reductase large subunit
MVSMRINLIPVKELISSVLSYHTVTTTVTTTVNNNNYYNNNTIQLLNNKNVFFCFRNEEGKTWAADNIILPDLISDT